MSDNPTPVNNTPRVFQIGAAQVIEDASTVNLSNEAMRTLLKVTHPEVAHAIIREREQDGIRFVEFLSQPGHKG